MNEEKPVVPTRIIDHVTMVKQAINRIITEVRFQAELPLRILGIVEFEPDSRAHKEFGVNFLVKVPGHSKNALAVPLRVVDIEERGGRSIRKRMGKSLIAEVRISLRDDIDRVRRAIVKALKPMLNGLQRKMEKWRRRKRPKIKHRDESREFVNRSRLCCMAH